MPTGSALDGKSTIQTSETHLDSADTRQRRGINSIQLFRDGARWRIVGVLWDNERPDKPIPPEFLKPGARPA